jgi:7-cyano-7-deazaguanine synthase
VILALHSGGIDSTVLLYDLLAQGHEVRTIGFDYGQRHVRELAAAATIASDLGIQHEVVALPDLPGSSLTTGEGVVVPNRNMILLAVAASRAITWGADTVAIACHAGDHALFPDCRPAFLEEMFRALRKGAGIALAYPFARMTKLDVVAHGMKLGVPFDRTWSCYVGGDQPCGECLACRERREALHLAGVTA